MSRYRYCDVLFIDDTRIQRLLKAQAQEGFEFLTVVQPFKNRLLGRFIFKFTGITDASWEEAQLSNVSIS